jgi:crotonobetainyl-CoA:carnitine CoA-transferase CaiB-like acyl-CoA transferase
LHWNGAFRVFPAKDGHVLLSLFYQWETLVEWLESEGRAEDLTDAKWRDRDYRLQHLDHVIEVLERWTRTHPAAELVARGQSMRFPWAEVASIPQLLASPQLKERNFWVEVEHPETGRKYRFPGAPAKLSRSPWRVGNRAPMAGEANKDIYQKLGLSAEEIRDLIKDGVI